MRGLVIRHVALVPVCASVGPHLDERSFTEIIRLHCALMLSFVCAWHQGQLPGVTNLDIREGGAAKCLGSIFLNLSLGQ